MTYYDILHDSDSIYIDNILIHIEDIAMYIEMHEYDLKSSDFLKLNITINCNTHNKTNPPTGLGEFIIQNSKYFRRTWTSCTYWYITSNRVYEIEQSYAGPGCNDQYYSMSIYHIDDWYANQYKDLSESTYNILETNY